MKLLKLTYLEIYLLLVCFILLFVFGPSFGVVFICGVSFIVMVLRRINFKKHVWLKRVLIGSVVIITGSFLLTESLVISEFGSNDSHNLDVDCVVVLGAGLRGDTPSLTLKQRLDSSLTYLNDNANVPVLVSGGRGSGEDITEAEAMRDYLINHGIPQERILLEDKSTSTEENLLFSKTILNEKGLHDPKIIIVTSDYHMFRAKLLADRVGLKAYGISSTSPNYLKVNYMVREYFAMIKSLL